MRALSERQRYQITSRLSCMDGPLEEGPPVRNADDLLRQIVQWSDAHGRYFAHPALLARLFWWEIPIQWDAVSEWLDELVARGDVRVEPLGLNAYSSAPQMIVTVQKRNRFQRFSHRTRIPDVVRQLVYRRDGYCCVQCGTSESLTLDHIHPWSRGGEDHPSNLQTLCRPCNSRKGARV